MDFLQFLKQYDRFGKKADFTYKTTTRDGVEYDSSVKTKFGATITLIYYALFLATVVVKTNELFNGEEDA